MSKVDFNLPEEARDVVVQCLTQWRAELGLNQDTMAERMDMSRATWSRYERYGDVPAVKWAQICRSLGKEYVPLHKAVVDPDAGRMTRGEEDAMAAELKAAQDKVEELEAQIKRFQMGVNNFAAGFENYPLVGDVQPLKERVARVIKIDDKPAADAGVQLKNNARVNEGFIDTVRELRNTHGAYLHIPTAMVAYTLGYQRRAHELDAAHAKQIAELKARISQLEVE